MTRTWKLAVPAITVVAFGVAPGFTFAHPSGEAATGDAPTDCSFDRGVTTCVSITERTETAERIVTSGCVAGPTGVPGVRRTTYRDTYTIIEVTETKSHGHQGIEFDTTTSTTRVLTSSVELSSTCEPISEA